MFSICMATMNAADTLERAISSILMQDTDDYEIVISDGNSIDGTLDILQKYREKINLVSESDSGIADAWNKAIKRTRGKWLYFLGADDVLATDQVLSSAAKRLKDMHGLVAYGDVNYVNTAGREVCRSAVEWDADAFRRSGMTFSHQGVFHHRDLFELYGLFSTNFSIAIDYELLLRYLLNNDAIHFMNFTVAHAQISGLSSKSINMLRVMHENRLAQRKHGIHGNSATFYRALAGALVKNGIIRLFGETRGERLIEVCRPLVRRPRRD